MTTVFKSGDLLQKSNIDPIFNIVNCVGVMGMGTACSGGGFVWVIST